MVTPPEYESGGLLEALRRTVRLIPRGRAATYGTVAEAAGFPGAARQVAWALHNSSAGIPWQRVVGAGGRILLPGIGGAEQRLRLEQEGVAFRANRVAMDEYGIDAAELANLRRGHPARRPRRPSSK